MENLNYKRNCFFFCCFYCNLLYWRSLPWERRINKKNSPRGLTSNCFLVSDKTESQTFNLLLFTSWRWMETACRDLWYVSHRDPHAGQANLQSLWLCPWSYSKSPLFGRRGTLRQTGEERTSRISWLTVDYDKLCFVNILLRNILQCIWSRSRYL